MPEVALPLPALPARSARPLYSSVMTLALPSIADVGVSVAVQVIPPSPVLKFESEPLGAVRSAVVKPVMASENVKVTVAVSPIFSAVSLIVMLLASVGRAVSMA